MPGIFGLILKHGGRNAVTRQQDTLNIMAAAMQYETFYAWHRFDSAALGISAGWVGPVDDAEAHAPWRDEEFGLTMLTAGDPQLDGVVGRPTAVTARGWLGGVAAIRRHSRSIPAAMRGLFAGFVVDERRRESVLFTDRFGFERLFVYEGPDAFYFSSEAKAILAAAPATREFDPDGLAQFLACGSTLGTRSLFRGIRVLPGGTMLTFDHESKAHPDRYFERSEWEQLEPLPEPAWREAVAAALDRAVERDAAQARRSAVSLTGGLDSRIIMASLDPVPGAIPCYTFGSMYRDTYDVRAARTVAGLCGQRHQSLVLDDAFLANLGEHFDKAVMIADGGLGLSGAAELYVNTLARRVAPVRVTGNYGGELLRGIRAFKSTMPRGDFLSPAMADRVRAAIHAFSKAADVQPLSFTLFLQAPAGFSRYALERSQVAVRSPFLDDEFVQLLYRRPVNAGDPSTHLIARRRPDLLTIPTDRGLLGRGGPLVRQTRWLYREGLFKAEYWTGRAASAWVARMAGRGAASIVERAFLGRHKFVHARPWLRGTLGQYMRDVLFAEETLYQLGAFVDVPKVGAMLMSDVSGSSDHSDELDRVVTAAAAARVLFRPRTASDRQNAAGRPARVCIA
ncbi:MAG TPA: asparagine synthase-related protein [Vicinamibacterales bacterium]|nr:asparagine synthase-related protein [Vicinamibacterales bacterium]